MVSVKRFGCLEKRNINPSHYHFLLLSLLLLLLLVVVLQILFQGDECNFGQEDLLLKGFLGI